MYTTNLRKVGGSVMLAIPPVLLDLLHLRAGANVNIDIEGNTLIVKTPRPNMYSLEELLAQCEPIVAPSDEERDWLESRPVGLEII